MHGQLDHTLARQRRVELQHAGEQARLASEVDAGRRRLRDPNPITHLSLHLAHLTARPAPTRP